MKTTSETFYKGNLKCISIHSESGTEIGTDAPKDNKGEGSAFSPTDLCATSLAECALTTIAILHGETIDITGAKASVQKIMSSSPRRIAEIICTFSFPGNYSEEEKATIRKTAENCPVAKSLHPDIVQTLEFTFG